MLSRRERERFAVVLAEHIVKEVKPEYTSYGLIENCGLSPEELHVAAAELAELGIIQIHHNSIMSDVGFISIRLKTNGENNARKFIELKKSSTTPESRSGTHLEYQHVPTTREANMSKSVYQIVGSPYGFSETDWQIIEQRMSESDTLSIVLGYQFKSEFYNSETLIQNLTMIFTQAVGLYNEINSREKVHLVFKPLRSGFGEHLFNEISRDILSADIAIFEVSDRNPNVMIELGIALTCGVSVLPIREHQTPDPPSDISGHTWIKYQDSGKTFDSTNIVADFKDMISRAMSRKRRRIENN